MIARLAAVPLALALVACSNGNTLTPPKTAVKADDAVTIKGKVLGADGKPLAAAEIKLAKVTGDPAKWFTDQSAAGEAGKLDAGGTFTFSRKGADVIAGGPTWAVPNAQPAAAHHTVLITTPDVAAKTDDGRDVTAYTDGKVQAHPVGDLLGIASSVQTNALVLDLGASKAVDRVVLHATSDVARIVIGDAASGAGGKAFKPADEAYESVDVDGTGRYVRLEFQGTAAAMMPHAEVRVIGPKAN